MTIPTSLDNAARDEKIAWANVIAAQKHCASAINLGQLTAADVLRLVKAQQEHIKLLGKIAP